MKSFLQQIEEAFEAVDQTNDIIDDIANNQPDDELEEASTTGGVAGYMTPNAFSKANDDTVEVLGMKRVRESVRTAATYELGKHQRPESAEEEFNSKFPFADNGNTWQHKTYQYPTANFPEHKKYSDRLADVNEPFNVEYDWSGIKNKTDKDVYEAMEHKYLQLIDESYLSFKNRDDKPSNKVKRTIQEIAMKLREIETLVGYNSKLKEESGVTSDNYGPATKKALNKISQRLIKISERVRALGE
jgi:hypothetical protein